MKIINENVKSSNGVDSRNRIVTGVDFFKMLHDRMSYFYGSQNIECNLVYSKVYSSYREELGHYVRLLYWTLTFIKKEEESGNIKKGMYGKILRAQLSDYELAILFYNCLSDYGENFRPLAMHFELFNSLADDLVFSEEHKSLFQELCVRMDIESAGLATQN